LKVEIRHKLELFKTISELRRQMKDKDKKIAGADKVKMSSVGLQTDLQ
jgi:hypothetical protein